MNQAHNLEKIHFFNHPSFFIYPTLAPYIFCLKKTWFLGHFDKDIWVYLFLWEKKEHDDALNVHDNNDNGNCRSDLLLFEIMFASF